MTRQRMKRFIGGLLTVTVAGLGLPGTSAGCVRRTLTIRTEPSGALVFLNDEEVGRSPVTTDFTWYGDYDVVLRLDGFQTTQTHLHVPEPWYEWPLLDFFSEILWPGRIVDAHEAFFDLEPEALPGTDELIERATQLRRRALTESN